MSVGGVERVFQELHDFLGLVLSGGGRGYSALQQDTDLKTKVSVPLQEDNVREIFSPFSLDSLLTPPPLPLSRQLNYSSLTLYKFKLYFLI